MTPLSFEWQWSIEYLIFMGLLYITLAIIAAGLIYTSVKTRIDLKNNIKEKQKPAVDHEDKDSD